MEELVQREYLPPCDEGTILTSCSDATNQLYAGLSGFILIVSFFFVPETAFERPLSAYSAMTATTPEAATDLHTIEAQNVGGYTNQTRPALDADRYGPRTFKKTIRVWTGKADWTEAWLVLKHTAQMVKHLVGTCSMFPQLNASPHSVSSRTPSL